MTIYQFGGKHCHQKKKNQDYWFTYLFDRWIKNISLTRWLPALLWKETEQCYYGGRKPRSARGKRGFQDHLRDFLKKPSHIRLEGKPAWSGHELTRLWHTVNSATESPNVFITTPLSWHGTSNLPVHGHTHANRKWKCLVFQTPLVRSGGVGSQSSV